MPSNDARQFQITWIEPTEGRVGSTLIEGVEVRTSDQWFRLVDEHGTVVFGMNAKFVLEFQTVEHAARSKELTKKAQRASAPRIVTPDGIVPEACDRVLQMKK